jgi:hypothetical protein
MTYKHIENNFLRKIKIQNTSELYIYPAGCIVGPLLAVPNIVDQKMVSKNDSLYAVVITSGACISRGFQFIVAKRQKSRRVNSWRQINTIRIIGNGRYCIIALQSKQPNNI